VWVSKFFTPEVRFGTSFVSCFNHPKDDSLGGLTETFRSNEIQLEHLFAKVPLDASDAGVVPRCPNSEHPRVRSDQLQNVEEFLRRANRRNILEICSHAVTLAKRRAQTAVVGMILPKQFQTAERGGGN
jgi:hypothetical protein